MLDRVFNALRSVRSPRGLEAELAEIENRADESNWDFQAHLFNRAGDLCEAAGERQRALAYYGRAIDAHLSNGYFDVAAAMCGKVIDLDPAVLRARCTLAFLSLGKDLLYLPFEGAEGAARAEIERYVEAATAQGKGDYAAQRLSLMAGVTDDHRVREMIGEYLLELGDTSAADKVFGAVYAERNEVADAAPTSQRERWAEALRVEVLTQQDRGQ